MAHWKKCTSWCRVFAWDHAIRWKGYEEVGKLHAGTNRWRKYALDRIHQIGTGRVGTGHTTTNLQQQKNKVVYHIYFSFLFKGSHFLVYVAHTRVLNTFICTCFCPACSCATIINSFGKFTLPKRWFRTYIYRYFWLARAGHKNEEQYSSRSPRICIFCVGWFSIINIQNGIFHHFAGHS